jgi:hypothetical protein
LSAQSACIDGRSDLFTARFNPDRSVTGPEILRANGVTE